MKRLAATRGSRRPHKRERGQVPQVEASHGAYWHRRAQKGKPAVHPDGAGRSPREADPYRAWTVLGSVRRSRSGEGSHRGLHGERMGGPVPRAVRPRGDRGGPELRADVRDANAAREDGQARCAGARRRVSDRNVPEGAPHVGSEAPAEGPARGAGGTGEAAGEAHHAGRRARAAAGPEGGERARGGVSQAPREGGVDGGDEVIGDAAAIGNGDTERADSGVGRSAGEAGRRGRPGEAAAHGAERRSCDRGGIRRSHRRCDAVQWSAPGAGVPGPGAERDELRGEAAEGADYESGPPEDELALGPGGAFDDAPQEAIDGGAVGVGDPHRGEARKERGGSGAGTKAGGDSLRDDERRDELQAVRQGGGDGNGCIGCCGETEYATALRPRGLKKGRVSASFLLGPQHEDRP